jgi:hypothetical protein
MRTAKQLIFAPLFLLTFYLFLSAIAPIVRSYDFLFSLDIAVFIQSVETVALLMMSAFFFIIFLALSQRFAFTAPVALVAAALPIILFPAPVSYFLTLGTFISLLLVHFLVEDKMKRRSRRSRYSITIATIWHL